MKVRFWGVRGSVPTPGPKTVKYGGNTACIEIRGDDDELLIIDAGTGLRELGNFLISNDLPNGPLKLNILLTHTHWDHIQGFPFFGPAYIPSSIITFRGPVNAIGKKLDEIVAGQMNYSYFPIKLSELRAQINFVEIREESFDIGSFHVSTCYLNHPILCLGYRIMYKNKVIITIYDNEPYRNIFADTKKSNSSDFEDQIDDEAIKEAEDYVYTQNQKILDFASGADLMIYDAQYTSEEFKTKIGWGHSTIDHAINAGISTQCKKLALFHHDPVRTDKELDTLQVQTVDKARGLGARHMVVFFARERLEVNL
ncbi:MAG: MBL fold metallo-hydrolase [Spirochaetota bacterium]|nr:MBL fold metallo-hydrolase [Spirochaetota bacterium]